MPRKLDPAAAKASRIERIEFDEPAFRRLHGADEMSLAKLQDGIDGFTKAVVDLEKALEAKLAVA